jgi:hypothetical protein
VGVRLLVWGRRTYVVALCSSAGIVPTTSGCVHIKPEHTITIQFYIVAAVYTQIMLAHRRSQRETERQRRRRTKTCSSKAPRLSFSRETSCRELMPCAHQPGRFQLSQTYVEIIGRFMRRTPALLCFSCLSLCVYGS